MDIVWWRDCWLVAFKASLTRGCGPQVIFGTVITALAKTSVSCHGEHEHACSYYDGGLLVLYTAVPLCTLCTVAVKALRVWARQLDMATEATAETHAHPARTTENPLSAAVEDGHTPLQAAPSKVEAGGGCSCCARVRNWLLHLCRGAPGADTSTARAFGRFSGGVASEADMEELESFLRTLRQQVLKERQARFDVCVPGVCCEYLLSESFCVRFDSRMRTHQ